MSASKMNVQIPRRDFLKGGGALIIGFSLWRPSFGQDAVDAVALAAGPGQPDPKRLDTWLAIHSDNTATVFFGFAELGQGNSTALLQIAAEELDLDMRQVKTVRLDTNRSPNQGGTVASASISRGGPRIRAAAAQARLFLLTLASKKLDARMDELTVSKGIVSAGGGSKQSVTYGELIGGRLFKVPYKETAPLKPTNEYKIVGMNVARNDIPDKASGNFIYVQHVRVPNMLHGRVVRPRGQAAYGALATVGSIDEVSIRAIPGVQVVRKRNFVGVVAANEWNAIRAAEQLKVSWDISNSLSGNEELPARMRVAKTTDEVVLERGSVTKALEGAAHVVSRTCFGPYQSHAVMGPNCAVADVTANSAHVMCSTQNLYESRANISRVLRIPAEKVRIQYYEGAGTYGHSCYEDVAEAAAIMSQAVGKPVRVQFMRWDEHGWDNYGPAHLADIHVAADKDARIVAYEYQGSQHTWMITETSEQLALGAPAQESDGPVAQRLSPLNLGSMYDIANTKLVNRRVSGIDGYPKGSYLRSPLDISIAFTSEQAIDELAHMLDMDPYLFRKRNIKDSRWMAVLDAVAKAAAWTPRKAASILSDADLVTGRGIAVGTHLSSYAAAVAEIEVNKKTGQIVAKHLYGALDAGLAINPAFLENQITGMLVQATSRILKEEVTFTERNVTSLDWNSYPVLRFEECPEVTPIVIQRMNEKSTGGGEEVLSPAAAAIANALFDATGIRLQRYPLTPERVLAKLASRLSG